jgi:hypothetical protein
MEQKDKYELMAVALQQRIGELVMSYEAQIASLRADLTILAHENEEGLGDND